MIRLERKLCDYAAVHITLPEGIGDDDENWHDKKECKPQTHRVGIKRTRVGLFILCTAGFCCKAEKKDDCCKKDAKCDKDKKDRKDKKEKKDVKKEARKAEKDAMKPTIQSDSKAKKEKKTQAKDSISFIILLPL